MPTRRQQQQQQQQQRAGCAPTGVAAAVAGCRRCWLTFLLTLGVVFLLAERWLSRNLRIGALVPLSLMTGHHQVHSIARLDLTAATTTTSTRRARPPAPAPGPSRNARSQPSRHSNAAASHTFARTVSLVCSLPHPHCSDGLHGVASPRQHSHQQWVTAEEKACELDPSGVPCVFERWDGWDAISWSQGKVDWWDETPTEMDCRELCCSLGDRCWTYTWWKTGALQGRCMYFSIFDDWSHDRFNDKENDKGHGWKKHSSAVSGIKFFREAQDESGQTPSTKRPPQLTSRNHFFTSIMLPEQVCPEWMQALAKVRQAKNAALRKAAVLKIRRTSTGPTFFPFPRPCLFQDEKNATGSATAPNTVLANQPYCAVPAGRCRHNFDCNTHDTRRVGTCNAAGWCECGISPDGGTELVKVKSQLQDLSTDVCRLRKWSGGRYCTMDEHCSDFPGKGYCWRGAAEKTKLGTFGVCYCWGPHKAIGAVHELDGATMSGDGTCLPVVSNTSRCLIRGDTLPGDQEWCRSVHSIGAGGQSLRAKWVANLGPDKRAQLAHAGWCNEQNLFNNHTIDAEFFGDPVHGRSNRAPVSADCTCCGPPRPRCFDSKLRLSQARPAFQSLRPLQSPASSSGHATRARPEQQLRVQNENRRQKHWQPTVCAFIGSAPDGMNGEKKFSLRRNAIADTWADNHTFVIWPKELPYRQDWPRQLTPLYVDIPKNLQYSEVTHRYFRLLEMLHPDVAQGTPIADCDFSLIVDDDAYINLPAWNEYFSTGWLNPDDVWYMGPFSSVRIDRGMMSFAHGTTIVFSRGLALEARKWLPRCYKYFDNAEGNVDFWGDVAIGKCLNLFSVYSLRPSKRLVMKNRGGDTAIRDVLKKKESDRQCLLSVHKLDERTIYDVHDYIVESKKQFPETQCGQEKRGWLGSAVLKSCDLPVFPATSLSHTVVDFCSQSVALHRSLAAAAVAVGKAQQRVSLSEGELFALHVVPHIETASLCAEACLAMATPDLCYVFSWNKSEQVCEMAGHAAFHLAGFSADHRKWSEASIPSSERGGDAGIPASKQPMMALFSPHTFVNGICRFSSAVPLPRL